MTDNTSLTGGVLTPAVPLPEDDDTLDAIFQQLVSAITGLDGAYVRPRWQPTPPTTPDISVNWCAIGVMHADEQGGPSWTYNAATDSGPYQQDEELTVLASFYGPQSKAYAAMLRDGVKIVQNLEGMLQRQIVWRRNSPIRAVPENINQQWRKRQDLQLTFGRSVNRTYQVTYIASANIHVLDDTGSVDDTVIVDSSQEP